MRTYLFPMSAAVIALAVTVSQGFAQETQRGLQDPQRGDRDRTELGEATDQDQSDRYQSRRVSANRNQGDKTVLEAVVGKLQKANENEIELAQMAQKKVENEQLRQLTQTIIQDHQQLNQELKKVSEQTGQTGQSRRGQARRQDRANARGQGRDNARNQDRENARDQDSGIARDQDRPATAGQRDRQATGRRANASRQGNRQANMVPAELCQLMEQACENSLQMTKEMLQDYQGQDFQMAFLGQQIVRHVNMLAELQAIESTGPQELQPIAQTAIQKVKSHLEQSKQLAQRFEDERNSRR